MFLYKGPLSDQESIAWVIRGDKCHSLTIWMGIICIEVAQSTPFETCVMYICIIFEF